MSKSENPKRQKLRNNEYYDFQRVQDDLYAKSQNGYNFKNLMDKIVSEANILLAYRNIKKNTGSTTKGTDVVPDVVPDVALDVVPDVDPDVALDVVPDVALDVVPDVALDVVPDVVHFYINKSHLF